MQSNRAETYGLTPAVSDFEAMLQLWYQCLIPLQADMVYDIGAHTGRHTQHFLELGREVAAFEPIPSVRERLSQAFADYPKLTVRDEALCNQTGTGQFVHNTYAPQESGIMRRSFNDETHATPEVIAVRYARLDDIHPQNNPISFIKMDTEGAEIDILLGATQTLNRHRPVISVEYGAQGYVHYGHSQARLGELCKEMGYVLFDVFGFSIEGAHYKEIVDHFSWDYLLIPQENELLLQALKKGQCKLAQQILNLVNAHVLLA